jgi:uncharacterized protein DUF4249
MKRLGFILLLIMLAFACREPYAPPAVTVNYNYLVVEGIISSGQPTRIQLSRTKRLTDTVLFQPETNAAVFIQSERGDNYPLQHIGNGVFESAVLNLNPTDKYRIRIATVDKAYVSAFESLRDTPPIDSISWNYDHDVSINVSTHDPNNSTWYYRWEFEETYEYWAWFDSNLGWLNGQIYYRDSADLLNKCWAFERSTDVLLGTSTKLSQDRIDQNVIHVIPYGSDKLGIKYSILVKQYSLTQKSFEYWETLRKNSRDLGSIFGVQPSQLIGNIKCVTNPEEPVIGYVTVSSVKELRKFITRSEINFWNTPTQLPYCQEKIYAPDTVFYVLQDTTLAPAYYVTGGGVAIAKKSCVDCTRRGGSTKKPSYW